jgi:hypothetical protein
MRSARAARSGKRSLGCPLLVLLGAALLLSALGPLVGPGSFGRTPPAAPARAGDVATASALLRAESDARPLRPGALGGEVILRATNNDSGAAPNLGAETNITDFEPVPMPAHAAFQANGEMVVGACQAVFGIFENWTLDPTAFFEIFNNTTDASVRLLLWPGYVLTPGTGYGFSFVWVGGTSWRAEVDGVPFADSTNDSTVDCGVAQSRWAGALTFSEVAQFPTTGFAPPNVTAGLAFATLVGGAWRLSTGAFFSGFGVLPGPWGMEGRLQHPTLAPDEVVTGPAVPVLANGTSLWTGGAVPVALTISVSNGSVPASSADTVVAQLNTTTGVPLAGVPLGFSDTAGGTFGPSVTSTGPTGRASTGWLSPNGSRAVTARLTATVRLPGYLANASVSVQVGASVELTVSAPASVTLAPSGSVEIVFRTTNRTGAPVAGALVEFSASSAVGSVTPVSATSDAAGNASTTFLAARTVGSATLTARVQGPGEWGVASVRVDVVAPPASLLQRVEPFLPDILAAAAIGAIAVGLFVYARRPRRPVPVLATIKPSSFLARAEPGETSPPSEVPSGRPPTT